jgi:hypothetical protein
MVGGFVLLVLQEIVPFYGKSMITHLGDLCNNMITLIFCWNSLRMY